MNSFIYITNSVQVTTQSRMPRPHYAQPEGCKWFARAQFFSLCVFSIAVALTGISSDAQTNNTIAECPSLRVLNETVLALSNAQKMIQTQIVALNATRDQRLVYQFLESTFVNAVAQPIVTVTNSLGVTFDQGRFIVPITGLYRCSIAMTVYGDNGPSYGTLFIGVSQNVYCTVSFNNTLTPQRVFFDGYATITSGTVIGLLGTTAEAENSTLYSSFSGNITGSSTFQLVP